MSELKEFASFVTLNMANLAATYAQLLADSNVGYEVFPTDSRVASGRKLLKAVVEVFESKTSNPLLQRFIKTKNEEYLRWAEDIDPPQPLVELDCLGQTLTPVVTNLEAGKYLWQILAETRAKITTANQTHTLAQPVVSTTTEVMATTATQIDDERLQLFANTSLDAVVMINAEGKVIEWNSQAEALFGWSREAIIGQQLSETIIPPQYREAHEEGLKYFLETGEGPVLNTRIEITALNQAGHEFPVELTIAPIQSEDTFIFIAFIRDITERKKTEEILRATEDQYRTFLEESPDPIVMYDMEGRTTYINPAFTQVFGWTSDEIIGQQVDFVPEESKAETQTAIETVFKQGRMSLESKRKTKDGRILDAWGTASLLKDNQGNPTGLLAILRDITERKQAELEREILLAETQALYRISQILSHTNDQREMAESILIEYLQVLNLSQGGVLLFNDDQTEGMFIALMQNGTLVEPGMQLPVVDNPSLEKMIETKAPVVIADALTDSILEPVRDIVHELGYKSLLLVPIIVQDKVIGALGADSVDQIYHFADREIELVKTVADRFGAALENRRLHNETQRRIHREQTIREITDKMRSAVNLEQLIKTTTEELGQRFSAEYALLEVGIEPESDYLDSDSKSEPF